MSVRGAIRRGSARQFSALSVYNFRVYFCGQLISTMGTWMQTTAQAWLVLKLTNSPLALGTVVSLQFLPITFFTLFGGAFADRFPRRRVMFFTQTAAGLQALLLGTLVVTGTVQIWHVFVLAATLGLINSLDGPLRTAFAVDLVGREHLSNAVSLNSLVQNLGRILGPALGGLVIGFLGVSTAFFLNAASFVPVFVALLILDTAQLTRRPSKTRGNLVRQVGEGMRYAFHTPALLYLFLLGAFIGMFGYNFSTMIPLVAQYLLHAGSTKFGLLNSCLGCGSAITALVIAARGRASGWKLILDAFAFGAILVLIGLSRSFLLTGVLFVLVGSASVTFSTSVNTGIQLIAPEAMRGRMASIWSLLIGGSSPIGGELSGFLARSFGVSSAMVFNGTMCCLGVGAALLYLHGVNRRQARESSVLRSRREGEWQVAAGEAEA